MIWSDPREAVVWISADGERNSKRIHNVHILKGMKETMLWNIAMNLPIIF